MSVIIQVGHSSSYSDQFMQILYERGLGEPFKSHAYQLTAREITDKIIKILQKNNSPNNIKILENLMMDLLLSNLDQDDWGWASEHNLEIVDYWKNIDDTIHFILIFDSPKLLLKHLLKQAITVDDLEVAIQKWIAYHQRLLMFFENSSKNCLLIEGELAINNLMNVKDRIQAITTNFKIDNNKQKQVDETIESISGNSMFDVIINEVLVQYPDCLALYETLIKKSSIRFKDKKLSANSRLSDLIHLSNIFNEQQILQQKLLVENSGLQNQLLALISEKQSLEQQLSQNILLLEQSKNNTNAEQKAQMEQSEQENRLLISQLHQAQEELERYYLQNQKTAEQLKLMEKQKQQLKAQVDAQAKLESELNAIKEAKQQAEQQQAQASHHTKQENELLISQLHQVQEELERYYLENQRLKSAQTRESPKPVYYGAANRIKEDLPYRLGATMVSHSKSAKDLAVLPLALAKEYREFNKNKPSDELPAIEEYQDAYEAEKVKKHLSYRLGKTLVDGVKSKKVLDLPVKLGREIVGFGNSDKK